MEGGGDTNGSGVLDPEAGYPCGVLHAKSVLGARTEVG